MVNLQHVVEADRYNWQAVGKIVRVVELVPEEFSLLLAHCNYAELQHTMVDWVLRSAHTPIRVVHLKPSDRSLLQAIQAATVCAPDPQPEGAAPPALMVTGFELVEDLDQLLKAANQVRDEFRKCCPFPLILWVNDQALRQMIRLAPDFQSWATTIDFQPATSQLIRALTCGEEQLFERVLAAGVGRFLNNTTIFGSRYRDELMAALRDLTRRRVTPDAALQASLEFLLGREAYANNNLAEAEERYSRSLLFWQQTHNWQRQGILFYSLGLLWRTWAEHNRIEHRESCQRARTYFQRCIDTFETAQHPELTARFINALGEVLQRLEQWPELEQVAQRALELHRAYSDPFRLARAYGFLSEVALAREDWQDAKELAEQAIAILNRELPHQRVASTQPLQRSLVHRPGNRQTGTRQTGTRQTGAKQTSATQTDAIQADQDWERAFHQGWYLLAHARACVALGQPQSAIYSLEVARRDTNPQYDPDLYIRILNHLRLVYFQQKQYLQAFKVRQDRRAIEYQFGFRAFLGATRLQPMQTVTNPAIATQTGQWGIHELTASGRQADIDRLVARLGRTDNRLTVLYGQSGVGKSSILSAGLIPTLQRTTIRSRDTLPVLQQVYTDWEDNLHEALLQSLGERRVPLDAVPNADTLTQIALNDERNFLTVLIFDQFEEFYSACKHPQERQAFYEFLKRCLDIPYVKVIIALREDYLHHLLEITRFTRLEVINNNILDQQILYYIGNFSREEAKAVIDRLTERTPVSFEPALVDALVDDLAVDLNQVSPIELQIVGAQMHLEGITTLKVYREQGPKTALVKRYVKAAVENCGPENQQLAKQILYFLTEEQGTRPLKTRTELAEEAEVDRDQLDPVLHILVGAGLVFELPSASIRYYQLVHDYLVPFIRREQRPELMAELKQTRAELKQTLVKEQQERKRAEMAEIKVLNALSQALLLSHDHLGALLSSVKAGRKLLRGGAPPDIEQQTKARLWQTLNQIREVNRFTGHRATVFDVAFSPDGQRLASASADHTVRLWAASGQAIAICSGHRDQVYSVAFHPNGSVLASASADKTIRLWRRDGVPIRTLKGHRNRVFGVCFSPDGEVLASAGEDGTVCLWNAQGDALSTIYRGVPIYHICFSPDSAVLAAACDGGKIRLWHRTGTLLAEVRGHEGRVHSLAFSADGQMLLSTGEDGAVRRWGRDGAALDSLHQQPQVCHGVCISPDNQMVALTGAGSAVSLYAISGESMTQFYGHSSAVYGVDFSSNGRLLASAGDDRTIRLWDLDGLGLYVNQGHRRRVLDASLSPQGYLATGGEDHTVKLWRLNGELVRTFHGHGDIVRSVSFSPNGDLIASASNDQTVRLCRTDGSLLQIYDEHYNGVRHVSFSPDGKLLISAGNDRTVRIWRLDGTLAIALYGHRARVMAVSMSPQGDLIAAASGRTVHLWRPDGDPVATLQGHGSRILDVQFGPDGQQFATASANGTVKLWHRHGRLLTTLRGHDARARGIRFMKDGSHLMSYSADRTVRIWPLAGGDPKVLQGQRSPICYANVLADQVVVVEEAGRVRGWDLAALLAQPDGLEPAFEFSLNGRPAPVVQAELDLSALLGEGCRWLRDYLTYSAEVAPSDRRGCDRPEG